MNTTRQKQQQQKQNKQNLEITWPLFENDFNFQGVDFWYFFSLWTEPWHSESYDALLHGVCDSLTRQLSVCLLDGNVLCLPRITYELRRVKETVP